MPYGQIYEIKCLVNHKRYIGRTTKILEERFADHVRSAYDKDKNHKPLYQDMLKYSKENFVIKQICECDNKEQLAETEAIYTELWMHFYGKENIYNIYIADSPSEEHKKKHSEDVKGNTFRAIPVKQYDLEGNFIREWPSASEAQRELGISQSHISACCSGTRNKTGGFIWRRIK